MTRILSMPLLCLAFLVGCDNSASRTPSGPGIHIKAPDVNIEIKKDTPPGPAKGGVEIDVPGVKVDVNEGGKNGVKVDVLPKKE